MIGAFSKADAIVLSQTTGGNLAFTFNPKNPGELTNVEVTAQSLDTDLERSQIVWYLDGNIVTSGVGINTFGFQTGRAGKASVIRVVVVPEGIARMIEKTATINPADVDIIWQADSYVPPLYKGKALAGAKGTIKLVAMPNFISAKGIKIDQKDIKYEWKKNFDVLERGTGKNVISTQIGSPLVDTKISLIAVSPDGSISAEKTITIKPENPIVLFYEEKPIEGLDYSKALGANSSFNQNEITIKAEPYFFSTTNYSLRSLFLSWTMNGVSANPSDTDATKMILRNEAGREVTSIIGLQVKNTANIYQDITTFLNITSRPSINF